MTPGETDVVEGMPVDGQTNGVPMSKTEAQSFWSDVDFAKL